MKRKILRFDLLRLLHGISKTVDFIPHHCFRRNKPVLQRARDWWEGQSRNNQIIFGATAFGVLVALIGFVMWAGQPEYSLLFGELAPQDASAITDKLREQNVPYRLAPGGKAIEVPAQKRDELRMQLLSQQLPHQTNASIGYDILNSIGPMTTDRME